MRGSLEWWRRNGRDTSFSACKFPLYKTVDKNIWIPRWNVRTVEWQCVTRQASPHWVLRQHSTAQRGHQWNLQYLRTRGEFDEALRCFCQAEDINITPVSRAQIMLAEPFLSPCCTLWKRWRMCSTVNCNFLHGHLCVRIELQSPTKHVLQMMYAVAWGLAGLGYTVVVVSWVRIVSNTFTARHFFSIMPVTI